MRIVIETDEGEAPKPSVQAQPGAQAETTPAAPPEIAATAAALGAASAGPAPPEAAAEEPATFVGEPGTPETAPDGQESMSAGAAPQFALGPVEEVAAANGAEAREEAEG
jgi:hypothetical protein